MDVNDRRGRAGEEAAEWWTLLRAGSLSDSERVALVAWLRESPVHVAEMLRIARVHGLLQQFTQWSAVEADGAAQASNVTQLRTAQVEPRTPDRGRSRSRWLGAIAAGVVISLMSTRTSRSASPNR